MLLCVCSTGTVPFSFHLKQPFFYSSGLNYGIAVSLNSSPGSTFTLSPLPLSSLLRYGGSMSLQSAMSVRFNSAGTQLLALRRRLPPVLYELHSRLPSFQFDNQGYFNSCTMKSCCFAGDRDQVSRPRIGFPVLEERQEPPTRRNQPPDLPLLLLRHDISVQPCLLC